MFVSNWMTKDVQTLTSSDSILDAARLMEEKNVKHIPVVKEGQLKGIISDRDVRSFQPSTATSLETEEIVHLMSHTKLKEAMGRDVLTTTPQTPLEKAAMVMLDAKVGCLPVIEHGKVVGIISDKDIFRALVDITGVRHGGHRIYVEVEDSPGVVKTLSDIVRKHGFSIQSILSSWDETRKRIRRMAARVKGSGDFSKLKMELEGVYSTVRIVKG